MTRPADDARTAALRAASAARSADARARAEAALRELLKRRAPISARAVAEQAGVSRKYLYDQPDLLERIQHLRGQQRRTEECRTPAPDDHEPSIVTALRHTLRTLEERHRQQLAELRAELKRREDALAAAHGEILQLREQIKHQPRR